MRNLRLVNICFFSVLLDLSIGVFSFAQPIDRKALVERHKVVVEKFDSLASLTVGNGEFAFTVDATGLQTFPEFYEKGICLGTQSQWGWHSFPNLKNYRLEESYKEYDFHGRKIKYLSQVKEPPHAKESGDYFRVNPHRLHLGCIGLELLNADNSKVKMSDISNIHEVLNPWNGEIHSTFLIKGKPVEVITYCHQNKDLVAAKVRSSLIKEGLLKINFRFPYPTGGHVDSGCDWNHPAKHSSDLTLVPGGAVINRKIDASVYYVKLAWRGTATIREKAKHYFVLSPSKNQDEISFSCLFSTRKPAVKNPGFDETDQNNRVSWKKYWTAGGAVDFSGSTDERAPELERRIVLSQYLLRVQCAGSVPPQETGLTCNSWYGKFHLEMHWWHEAHFAFWNHIDILEKSMAWYGKVLPEACRLAKSQGFEGARWPKMTDPSGINCPSSVGSVLIWEEPHIIYFAELCYRHYQDQATLEKYKDLVFKTADFMASYAWYEKEKDRYVLGPGLIPAQECFDAATTINPPFELAYWYYGLSTAQKWRERLNMPRDEKWDVILKKLSKLAQLDGLYLGAESVPGTYTIPQYTTDHPAVLGAFGMLPYCPLVDFSTMLQTFNYIWSNWKWGDTWGWDFPLTAMSATRLGMPDKAVDALFMNSPKNTYLLNGHNYQDTRLRLYLPGNGGLLSAVAMMCAGYDGCKTNTPGFPKNGQWKVNWENLSPLP